MLKYLNGQEKERCRSLWEEAFPEDSQSFVDYYFKEKMKDYYTELSKLNEKAHKMESKIAGNLKELFE